MPAAEEAAVANGLQRKAAAMYVMGLDVGTTGVKACVFDAEGAIKGSGFREYGVLCEEPGMGEQDAAQVWALAVQALGEAIAKAQVRSIRAIGVSVQGDAVIPVDDDLTPIYNAVLGMDYRSEPQARQCAERLGERALYDRTGMRPHPMNALSKMLWLREMRPDVWKRTRRVLTYADFVNARLCGAAVIDHTMASRTMAFDLERRAWAADLLDQLGVDPGLLSRAQPSGTTIGMLGRELCTELRITEGAQVVTGGHDQVCAALGAGVVAERRAVISTGTAQVLSCAFARRPPGDTMFASYYPCYLHAVKDLLFTFALNHAGGLLFRWYRDTLGVPEVARAQSTATDPYNAIIRLMPEGPSPLMVLPHWGGSGTPSCDLRSKGAILGLSLASTRHDIAKAILEALSFELRINCQRMREAGLRHDELVAVGGGARSEEWLQLKADILGCPLRTLAVREAACLGAGLLAGVGSGLYESADEAVGRTVKTTRVYEPNPEHIRRYDERFGLYTQLYPALREVNHRL